MKQPGRAGEYFIQPDGFRSFSPAPLPPDPPIEIDQSLLTKLSNADRALARLDAAADFLPDPELFLRMFIRREAALSSQIEGTQASLTDALQNEAGLKLPGATDDSREISNYVVAMNYGLKRLKELPLSKRLIREIHQRLLDGVRGGQKYPGNFRDAQNYIGPEGAGRKEAIFVPPTHQEAARAMDLLERFIHDQTPMPVLVKCALIHSQFETIHPFFDGNGRVGRLLITFFLCEQKILKRPVLYLSYFFKQRRQEYYDRLQAVRDQGDWESWLAFFLEGVHQVAHMATDTAADIQVMRKKHRALITGRSELAPRLLDLLYEMPVLTVTLAAQKLGCTYQGASGLLKKFHKLGILQLVPWRGRRKAFVYADYLNLFEEPDKRI